MSWILKAIVGVITTVPALAQVSASVSTWDHAAAIFSAINKGGAPPEKLPGYVSAAGETVSRVIWNAKQGLFTGYDIAVKPDVRTGTATVWVEPLTVTSEDIAKQLGPRWNRRWREVQLPAYYKLPSVKLDSPVEIHLWKEDSNEVDQVTIHINH